jgi:hypothetical protein
VPILNYTTQVSAEKTVAEIQRILARAGAASVQVNYKAGEPTAVAFVLTVGDRVLPFRLPADVDGVYRIIADDWDVPRRLRTREQAQRIAWRVVKDWTEAQIALIQSGQASLAQLFLPHAVRPDGRTLFEVVAEDPRFLLGPGEGNI